MSLNRGRAMRITRRRAARARVVQFWMRTSFFFVVGVVRVVFCMRKYRGRMKIGRAAAVNIQ